MSVVARTAFSKIFCELNVFPAEKSIHPLNSRGRGIDKSEMERVSLLLKIPSTSGL